MEKQLCRPLRKSPEHYPAENYLPHPKRSDGLLIPPIWSDSPVWFYRGGRQRCPERALTCPRSHSRYEQRRHSSNPGLSPHFLPCSQSSQGGGAGLPGFCSDCSSHSLSLIRPRGGGSSGHRVSNKAQAVCQGLTCTAMSALGVITAVTGHLVCSRHFYILSQAHQVSFQLILQGKQTRRARRGLGQARRQNFHERSPWCWHLP